MSDSSVYSGQVPTQASPGQSYPPSSENQPTAVQSDSVVPDAPFVEPEPQYQPAAQLQPQIPVQPEAPQPTSPPQAPVQPQQPAQPFQPASYAPEPSDPTNTTAQQYLQQLEEQASNKPQIEEVALEWNAPSRPFKKRNRQYYTTIGVIVFLISMILFFAGQFLPIAVVIAVAFLAYVLSAIPPEIVTNRVTTFGIRTDDSLYYWEELGRYWFDEKFHQRLVHIEVSRFPNQITLLVGEQDEAELDEALGYLLVKEKPAQTGFDRAAQWLQEKIPLDTEA